MQCSNYVVTDRSKCLTLLNFTRIDHIHSHSLRTIYVYCYAVMFNLSIALSLMHNSSKFAAHNFIGNP